MATLQEIQDALSGIRQGYVENGANRNQMYTQMADYVRRNNLDPSMVAQAATNASGSEFTPSQIRQIMAQYPGQRAGMTPAMDTLQSGANDATARIGQTQGQVSNLFQQGLGRIQPYMDTGVQANALQAALSGASGMPAQQQAYADFQNSPGQQWLVEQGERALTRNAAALGGLGGGNVRQELVRFGQGAAAQDFNNAFQRLGQVGDRGFTASTQGAGFGPQEASIQSNLGQFSANIPLQTAQAQAGMQFQTGRDMSSNIGQTSSALANLLQQQGAGQADIIGGASQNFANLYQQASQGDATAREQLGTMLANIGMQGAGSFAGVPNTPMVNTNYLGQVGQLAGGIGGLLAGVSPNQQQPTQQPFTMPSFNTQYQAPSLRSF